MNNEELLRKYNTWLVEVWNPKQLHIPFIDDAPRAYLEYLSQDQPAQQESGWDAGLWCKKCGATKSWFTKKCPNCIKEYASQEVQAALKERGDSIKGMLNYLRLQIQAIEELINQDNEQE